MWPYLLSFFSSILFAYFASKMSKAQKLQMFFWSFLCVLIPILLAGFRDYMKVGTDSFNYYRHFLFAIDAKDIQSYMNDGSDIEFGYKFFVYACTLVSKNYITFFILLHSLILLPLYYALFKCRKFVSIPLAMFIFFFLFYNMSLNISRQAVALSFSLLGTVYLLERKIIKYFICLLIAVSFHRTAVVTLLIFVMYLFSINYSLKKHIKLYCAIGFIFSLVIYNLFTNIAELFFSLDFGRDIDERYIFEAKEGDISKSSFIYYIFVSCVFIVSCVKNNNKLIDFFLTISFLSMILIFLTTINKTMSRIGLYFTFTQIISIPYIFGTKYSTKLFHITSVSKSLKISICIFIVLMWFFSIVYHRSHETYPYVITNTILE